MVSTFVIDSNDNDVTLSVLRDIAQVPLGKAPSSQGPHGISVVTDVLSANLGAGLADMFRRFARPVG